MERLAELVNYEIESNNQTILGFSVKCEISYNEMRKICNRKARDVKISTICKICDNSQIKMADIFAPTKDIDIVFVQNGEYFRLTLKKC